MSDQGILKSAVRLPLNMSVMEKVGDKFKKEILRVGEIVVDAKTGRKFNFTSDFLRGIVSNFGKVLDYVPLLYTDSKNAHTATGHHGNYAGTVEELSLDDPVNPTKVYGTFNLTDDAKAMIEHNPRYGVSVTAHPTFVDAASGEFHGPMLLDVAGTHQPKLTKMDNWEKVSVMASEVQSDYDVLDLSNEAYVEEVLIIDDVKKGGNMAEETLNLSQEQIAQLIPELLKSEAVKQAINAQVQTETAAKDEEITRLSNAVSDIRTNSYKQIVESAISTYKHNGVPPAVCDYAEALMLSFSSQEQDQTIKLSVGDTEEQEINKVMVVTKMLDEIKGIIDLSKEKGEETEEEVELSDDQRTAAVNQLVSLVNTNLASQQ